MWKYGQNQGNQGGGGYPFPQQMQQQQQQMMQQQQMGMMGGPGGMQMNPQVPQGGPGNLMPGMSPQHQMQQQQMMQQQQQMIMPQQGVGGVGMGVGMGGGGGVMPQQQQQPQQQNLPQQQQNIPQQQLNPVGGGIPPGGGGGGAGTNNMLAISQQNPHKEINIVQLSRLGQETVQDIASRFQEVFASLKNIQPTSHRDNNTEKKVQEYFRTIRLLFKRVRIIYEKCNDAGMDYMSAESLIPYRDEPEPRIEPSQCDEYRKVLQENHELIETVKLKNRQLREIIDRTRIIIWEINTMLAMRRS
ncbi:mediator of RNA polymerase II transcription subunit 30 [Drosophila takahashii]|uniref:mediator of RNA polymerase II transcription subunit 30 n=1 Tax=Drosophila takahashii TaxID=29030 RepID=UPI001CF858D7|nr:mediator of RNA polymerase II transcription subunit 30 [Drosophila takahashii]